MTDFHKRIIDIIVDNSLSAEAICADYDASSSKPQLSLFQLMLILWGEYPRHLEILSKLSERLGVSPFSLMSVKEMETKYCRCGERKPADAPYCLVCTMLYHPKPKLTPAKPVVEVVKPKYEQMSFEI